MRKIILFLEKSSLLRQDILSFNICLVGDKFEKKSQSNSGRINISTLLLTDSILFLRLIDDWVFSVKYTILFFWSKILSNNKKIDESVTEIFLLNLIWLFNITTF